MKPGQSIFRCINLLIFFGLPIALNGQATVGPERNTVIMPVDIPIFLAGNFGEPRANHFHSGIDIKTNGTTGISVKSVADGYVSRIKVEPGGYGKALYIRHPNGYTSLYGHLLSFNAEIAGVVLSEQYRRESFAVDIFPDPARLPVKKGQVIALSGNSGSSEGPHLHFELRETQSENPINPLVRAMPVKDAISPVIKSIKVYSLRNNRGWTRPVGIPLTLTGGIYRPTSGKSIPLDEISGLAVETFDLLDGSDNRCGVYRIRAFINEKLFFESSLDEFSFAETRYMNSFMDYQAYQAERKTLLRLFIEPNNQASVYRFARNRGRIELAENKTTSLKIIIEDVAGNQSIIQTEASLNSVAFNRDPQFLPVYQAYFNFEEANNFVGEGIEINMPAGAIYDDIYFDHTRTEPGPGCYSAIYRIHYQHVPVHLPFRLAIETTGIPESLKSKATIAQSTGNGRYNCLGGTWEGNKLIARSRSFGTFCIRTDTVRPVITPLNFSSHTEIKSLKSIKFKVRDDFSGIQTYRGEIDGKWILLEYDPKNSLLEYVFDPIRIKSGIQHNLSIRITDQLGNAAVYSLAFFR